MSDTSTVNPVTAPPPDLTRGAAIMVSFKELVEIRTGIASMQASLNAALALQGTVNELDKRVQAVEMVLAGRAGATKTWNTVLGFVAGAVSGALAGAAPLLLPHLIGH